MILGEVAVDTTQMDLVKLFSSLGSMGVLGLIAYMMFRYLPSVASKIFDTFIQLKDEFYKRHSELCDTFTREQEAQRAATSIQLEKERNASKEELRMEREQCQKQFETLVKIIDSKGDSKL